MEGRKRKKKRKKKENKGEENKREKEKKTCVGKKENDSDSRCSDNQKSIGRELKLAYSSRATSRCQKHKDVGFSSTLVPPNLRVINDCVIQHQPWD